MKSGYEKDGYGIAARFTVRRASEMTPKGRKQIAKWLRDEAVKLDRDGADYSATFVSRFWFKIPKPKRAKGRK